LPFFGIGAGPGHQEHRRPGTSVPTAASDNRRSEDRSRRWPLVPQPGQNTSSHGVPASSAARIVGDQSAGRRPLPLRAWRDPRPAIWRRP
jgi:hypothetical protein